MMSRETSTGPSRIRNSGVRRPAVVLLTGFEPFGGGLVNPSQLAAKALDGARLGGHEVRAVTLPCTFAGAPVALRRAVHRWQPRLVVALGLAGDRQAITPEAIARNLIDARIPDNAGRQPRKVPVHRRGPESYRSTLPVREIAASLRRAGLPAKVSRSAGRFVCNQVFYELMHGLGKNPGVRAGFIHVPPLALGRNPRGGLILADLLRGIRIAIEVSLPKA